MSRRYIGGTITRNPVAPSGPYSNSTASGIWGLNDAANFVKQGIWPTAGNINPDSFIENLFSTYLYTGNGSTQTITNDIDLSTKGGLVWCKARSVGNHGRLFDTARGVQKAIYSSLTSTEATESTALTTFNTNGFALGSNDNINGSGATNVSWTFRKQAKFFDIVTYTGNGVAGRQIAHSLGSVPGAIIVKNTNVTRDWAVWHRSLADGTYLKLNTTDSVITNTSFQVFGDASGQTSSVFTVGKTGSGVNGLTNANASGETYVAYLFAHNAGGFGLTGNDNVISCGSFTTDGSGNATVSLGYEPQWVMVKRTNDLDNWQIFDVMRGMSQTSVSYLRANTSGAEGSFAGNYVFPTATGVSFQNGYLATSSDFIYIAIRRGPMKVPTLGTTVFAPATSSATGSVLTTNFPVDMGLIAGRVAAYERGINDRLRGFANADSGSWPWLTTHTTAAETSQTPSLYNANNTSIQTGSYFGSTSAVSYLFRRAPGFFDEVCYTGTGANTTVTHNLAAVPELIIVKNRPSSGYGWITYAATLGATKFLQLNTTGAEGTVSTYWNNTTPTSSVFSVGTAGATNASAETFVAYLFATCPGVSKVGSYTGTGTTQTINCGFTAGSRFVLIKRTDSTGDWYVWDSARGIIPSNDPYLLLNSNAVEVTGTDYIDTSTTGFELSSTAPAAINANGGTYIFLAIA